MQALMDGLSMTISFLAFVLKLIVWLLYQSELVVPTIVSMKKPHLSRRPIP